MPVIHYLGTIIIAVVYLLVVGKVSKTLWDKFHTRREKSKTKGADLTE